jgi:hypothetical protein
MKQFLQHSQEALDDKKHRASTERESVEMISFVNISQIIKADQTPALMLHRYLLPFSSASDAAMLQLQFEKAVVRPLAIQTASPRVAVHFSCAAAARIVAHMRVAQSAYCKSCGTAPAISKIAHTVTTKVHRGIVLCKVLHIY